MRLCFSPIDAELAQGGQQLRILARRTNRDAQAVATESHTGTVAHHDTTVYEVVVDNVGIRHTGQEEVGLRGIDLLAEGQYRKGSHEFGTLGTDGCDPLVDLGEVMQHGDGLLLRQLIDVVGVLHLVKEGNDVLISEKARVLGGDIIKASKVSVLDLEDKTASTMISKIIDRECKGD